jgi:GT2 family glycosyltransferase
LVKVLAIIINFRTPELTLEAVASTIREFAEIPGRSVCVVENGSGDGSLETIRSTVEQRGWGDRVSIQASPENGGFAYGVNQGVRPALQSEDPPDYFYLLNSDAKPGPGAIEVLVRYLDEHPEVGIAGSYIHGPDGETHDTAFRFPSLASQFEQAVGLGFVSRLLDRWVVSKPVPREAARVDWLAGASMMIRREVFESVGLFDENFFVYFEETDFCRQAAQAGWPTWYLPESRVEHIGAASTGWKDVSKPRSSAWFDGRRYYFLKNHGRPYLWAANVLWVTGYLLWRVRAWIQRRPYPYPPRFFADFLRHNFSFRRIGRGLPRKT